MILFLDDEREFNQVCSLRYREMIRLRPFNEIEKRIIKASKDNVHTVRNVNQAKDFILTLGGNSKTLTNVPFLFLDNDLGVLGIENEGQGFLRWVCLNSVVPFHAYFHTANPVARKNMESIYNSFLSVCNTL